MASLKAINCPTIVGGAARRQVPITARLCPSLPVASRSAVMGKGISANSKAVARSVVAPSKAQRGMYVKAQASAAAGDAKEGGMGDTLILGALFGGWYAANIIFNIYNKTSLKAFPCPLTLTTFQFVIGALLSVIFWVTGLVKVPKITGTTVKNILPLAVVHTLGNLLTNVSLGAVAVSFTHTIKAMEPFFSVVLSAIFLGDKPSLPVVLTLLPIVGGVAAASMTEPSFNWTGFASAMGSNITFQSRNVLSKKLMDTKATGKEEKLDKMNIFALITIFSGFLLAPFAIAKEGLAMLPGNMAAMGIADTAPVYKAAIIAALCFHLYQQVSYLILSRVSPVTHSVGNCVKRVIVIVASVIFFQNPVSTQNAIGTAVALGGVFAYSQVKRLTGKGKGGGGGSD